tara:strand:+ start:40735 stop:41178 length:444 start_codon:yes stop_codon:yes gene_type:complete
MRLIAHRGNRWGAETHLENTPEYIEQAIDQGFDAEIDISLTDSGFVIGHDDKKVEVDINWILDNARYLWLHCKNLKALFGLRGYPDLNYFWHQEDDFTLTSQSIIWTYPNKPVTSKSVIVCESLAECQNYISKKAYGICSDYVGLIK